MCPFCLGTVALLAAGTAAAGGLTALAARKVRAKRKARKV